MSASIPYAVFVKCDMDRWHHVGETSAVTSEDAIAKFRGDYPNREMEARNYEETEE